MELTPKIIAGLFVALILGALSRSFALAAGLVLIVLAADYLSVKDNRERSIRALGRLAAQVQKAVSRRPRLSLAASALVSGGIAFLATAVLVGDGTSRATVSAGPITLEIPPTWRSTSAQPLDPAVDFTQAITLVPKQGTTREALVAGMTTGGGPSYLPADLRHGLADSTPPREMVGLGDLVALRYRNLTVKPGTQPLTLYAVPTDRGVATLACISQESVLQSDCERIVGSMTLTEATPLEIVPDADYTTGLDRIIAELNERLSRGRHLLRSASTVVGRAAAAEGIADGYAEGADSLDEVEAPSQTKDAAMAIADAMAEAEEAYEGVATAAVANDRRAYRVAAKAVEASERQLRQALTALHAFGYGAN